MSGAWGPRTTWVQNLDGVVVPDDAPTLAASVVAQSTTLVNETVHVQATVSASIGTDATGLTVSLWSNVAMTGDALIQVAPKFDQAVSGDVVVPIEFFDVLGEGIEGKSYFLFVEQPDAGAAGSVNSVVLSATVF